MKINNVIKAFLKVVLLLFVVTSCGPTVFLSDDAFDRTGKHNTIAILPPTVVLPASKNISAEAMKDQRKTESLNFQSEVYKQFLRRIRRNEMRINIQDYEETNALLARNFPDGIFTNEEACRVLKVDALLSSQFKLSKPMSQGAAIAAAMVFGVGGATNEVNVNMSLKDCSDNKLLWNYDWRYQGGLLSSPEDLVESLMRNASKRIPY